MYVCMYVICPVCTVAVKGGKAAPPAKAPAKGAAAPAAPPKVC